MMQISFPAIFSYDTDGITIEFPDFPGCISCGFTRDEAIAMSKEALSLFLRDWDENSVPTATHPSKITIDKKNQEIVLIKIHR